MHRPLSPAVPGSAPRQRQGADRAQCLQRADQPRRRAGEPLRVDLRAAGGRADYRLDHDVVRVPDRRNAELGRPERQS